MPLADAPREFKSGTLVLRNKRDEKNGKVDNWPATHGVRGYDFLQVYDKTPCVVRMVVNKQTKLPLEVGPWHEGKGLKGRSTSLKDNIFKEWGRYIKNGVGLTNGKWSLDQPSTLFRMRKETQRYVREKFPHPFRYPFHDITQDENYLKEQLRGQDQDCFYRLGYHLQYQYVVSAAEDPEQNLVQRWSDYHEVDGGFGPGEMVQVRDFDMFRWAFGTRSGWLSDSEYQIVELAIQVWCSEKRDWIPCGRDYIRHDSDLCADGSILDWVTKNPKMNEKTKSQNSSTSASSSSSFSTTASRSAGASVLHNKNSSGPPPARPHGSQEAAVVEPASSSSSSTSSFSTSSPSQKELMRKLMRSLYESPRLVTKLEEKFEKLKAAEAAGGGQEQHLYKGWSVRLMDHVIKQYKKEKPRDYQMATAAENLYKHWRHHPGARAEVEAAVAKKESLRIAGTTFSFEQCQFVLREIDKKEGKMLEN
ncbi:unnamed protein product [Amoebophrya sp. A120]|nr:unnamed protein product [Amoebophrya sp. A120]|eukprot:GSA120T00019967001.1